MNRRITMLCFFLVTAILLMGSAPENQGRSARKIMNAYRGEKGFISFSVPVFLAKIFIPAEDQEVKDLLRDVRRIRILVCEDASRNSGVVEECIHDFTVFFRNSQYVNLMEVIDNRDRVEIKAIPGENCFHDMILVASDEQEFAVIHLQGSVDLEKISNLIGKKEITKL
jgi:hypothetical protein